MMQKIWKALASAALILLLFVPDSPLSWRSLPKVLWVILFILTATYVISLFLKTTLPASRRFAIAYLVFVGCSYLLAGLLGLMPNWDLIEAATWNSLISPYVAISFVNQMVHHFPYGTSRAPYQTVPVSEHHVLSALVVVVSTVAIAGALAMTKPLKAAYSLWLVILGASLVSLFAYVLVGVLSWGLRGTVTPVGLEVSYLAAFIMARRGVDFRKAGGL